MPPTAIRPRSAPPARTGAWSTPLLAVCSGKDAGFNCCVQLCCCGPCTYNSALKRAGVRDASALSLLLCCGGNSFVDEFAGYVARRRLLERYGIAEDDTYTLLVSCVCQPCARVQEVSTVLDREGLRYGCAETVPDPPPPRAAPAQTRMRRV